MLHFVKVSGHKTRDYSILSDYVDIEDDICL